MAIRYFPIFFIFVIVYQGLSAENEYSLKDEFSKKQFIEDRLHANIVRARNSSKALQTKNNEENISDDRNADKKVRNVIRGSPSLESRGSNCCGTRHGSSSSSRPDYNRIPSENSHYSPSYGDRNVDRHSWQIPSRPTSSSIGGERPNVGNYGGSHSGSGIYGGTHTGDRYGPRPNYGSESSNRPGGPSYGSASTGGYGYGGYGSYGGTRPGHGITATFENDNDFNPDEADIPDNNVPQHPGTNIQTQKAVALKALAGVALIGAAAALATNPVLLPIGIISGRKKRSEITSEDNDIMDYVLQMITTNFSQTYNNEKFPNKKYVSPKCVARLTCEIRKDYMTDYNDVSKSQHGEKITKIQLNKLIQNNVLNAETVDNSVKELIKMALAVSSNSGDCGVFACDFRHNN
ncbi:PREDICTED: uncharacterized protein LOC107072928 [Polistes dominula]|uniref:Uncharacterized protein LOC107072928 n=1 Tax=Polistes dominula TaxID=743375 RepID=A0ABM1J8F5_POLDO|nr:PREDICTED: uncharacterized protein LOC107072928 [Polistes dominula]